MKVNYEELNELYSIMTGYAGLEDSEFLYKVGHAINLVDECEYYDDDSVITIQADETVLVTLNYSPCWPRYLIEEVENGDVTIDSAYNNFVTVEL